LALPVAFLRQWTRMVPARLSVRRFTMLNVFLRSLSRFRAKKQQGNRIRTVPGQPWHASCVIPLAPDVAGATSAAGDGTGAGECTSGERKGPNVGGRSAPFFFLLLFLAAS
jgi:hypothetical protein